MFIIYCKQRLKSTLLAENTMQIDRKAMLKSLKLNKSTLKFTNLCDVA